MPKLSKLVVAIAFIAATGLAAPPMASAQRAVVRVGAGRPFVGRGFRSVVFVGGFGFGYPYWYDPFGYPYGWGYGYGYPVYEGYSAWDVASLRIQITPKQAEVFVDGYRAGIVDDFNGIFQRLHVRPGGHDLVVYLPGYRTFEEHIYASPNSTQSIKLNMLPLAPGEQMTPPPAPASPPPAAQTGPGYGPGPGYGRGGVRVMPPVQVSPNGGTMPPGDVQPPPPPPPPPPPDMAPPPPPVNEAPPPPTDPSAYGTLSLRIQPQSGMGTVVLIDGERWATPSSSDQLLVRLAEGRHHVEIRRPGYATFVSDVDITRGTATPLNVSLVRR